MEENHPSNFYFACRNNDIETVHRLLNEQSLEDLDKIEPNGSTALHAACYYKNYEIVKLLIDRGFTLCVFNKYNNLAIDETDRSDIKKLFNRPNTSNRFGGNIPYESEKLVWILVEENDQPITIYRVTDTYDGKRLEYGLFNGEKILQQIGKDMPKIDVIRRLFQRAIAEKDAARLIQAYTAETDFYNRINNYLISQKDKTKQNNHCSISAITEYIDTIYLNAQLHQTYQFEGICYRSLKIKSHTELNLYKVGARLINRTFISTTKERQLAEQYAADSGEDSKITVLISFDIRRSKTALDIEYLSEYRHEKEVLILINSIFKVIRVTTKINLDVEIELRQSKSARIDQKKNKVVF